MINEAIKTLQDATPSATIDNSLTSIENLKFLLDSLKEYSSNLKEKTKKDVDSKFVEKILLELQDRCASAHGKVDKCLKEVQECEDGAKTLFLYCMRWPNATQGIKELMDSTELQITNSSRAYDQKTR